MDVLAGRVLLHPTDLERSQRFYREDLGLAVYREFSGGVVFFVGGAFLEVSGNAPAATAALNLELWLQVRDVAAEHQRLLANGVPIMREPRREPWGLIEMWVTDPDGVRIVLVEVPEDHPLRRDQRSISS
jgi:catechol 2,3-dioxygenase-like lactoylglutathione lyase family enzyme